MIVFLRCLYAALVSSARIVASADLFQRTREHPVGRALVIATREIIVERNDGLLVLLGFQILVREPEPDKRVLRIALQYLLECLDARCGHTGFCSLQLRPAYRSSAVWQSSATAYLKCPRRSRRSSRALQICS